MLLAAVCACVAAAGAAMIVDRALHRPRRALTGAERTQAAHLAASLDAQLDTVSLAAGDGVPLQGWLFTPGHPNGTTVVLLHGITSNRADLLPMARLVVAEGYRALALDGRGHGDSGGELVTFGALEAGDTRQWVQWIGRRDPTGCVFVFGGSLGAAVALQAADAPGVCGVIAQSGFASLREIAFDRIGQQLHTGPWLGRSVLRPGVEVGFLYARVRYGLDLGGAAATTAVARPGPPILVIHGENDDNAPVRHAHLLQQANPARVSLWIVPGGAHEGIGGAERDARVLAFLAQRR
ncbi:MAG: alpha/beta fold hydrolase [Vicinamibacterales bacterium]